MYVTEGKTYTIKVTLYGKETKETPSSYYTHVPIHAQRLYTYSPRKKSKETAKQTSPHPKYLQLRKKILTSVNVFN